MLHITIPPTELWDEENERFIKVKKETTLALEHSLVAISKWESKWCKPFLGKEEKTTEQVIDYVRCMTLTQNVDPNVYLCLPEKCLREVNAYIAAPMTATVIREYGPNKINREVVTSELIYYWMIALNIPFECQKWHLNRLLTLIRICNIKNRPNDKSNRLSNREVLERYEAINAARKKALNSKG